MAKSNDPIVYEIGHIKRNPETQAVAVKTIFSDTDPALSDLAWLMSTISSGAKNLPSSAVLGWDDLYVPPAPEPVQVPTPPTDSPGDPTP